MTEQKSRPLEERLRAIEDRLEIIQLVASHPPSADTGSPGYYRNVFLADGVMDVGGGKRAQGNDAIGAMVETPEHKAALAGGIAHFAGLPRIDIEGDKAVVTSYLQILTPHPSAAPVEVSGHGTSTGFRIHRVGANRWELERTADGWRIKNRTLRALDGSPEARTLLKQALGEYETGA